MKRSGIILFLVFITKVTAAQDAVLNDPVSARVFNADKYSGIDGSPFLYDKWITGSVTTPVGTYYKIEIKYDVYTNTLFFNKNDQLYEFDFPVVRFVLMPLGAAADSSTYLYFKRGFTGEGIKDEQFIQVLTEGTVGLYKSEIKLVTEVNEINRGVIKTFKTSVRYYILKGNNLLLIKPTQKNILNQLDDKEDLVKKFIENNRLSFKKDTDIARIFEYYNSL